MKNVQRLGRVDEVKSLALLDAIQPSDWKASSLSRFPRPCEAMYFLFPASHFDTGDSSKDDLVDRGHLWPHLTPLALELANEGRGSTPGEMRSLFIYRLPGGKRVGRHADTWCPLGNVRVHIPLQTDERNYYVSENIKYNMDVGWAWTVNNRRPHAVTNGSDRDRIHLITDWYEKPNVD